MSPIAKIEIAIAIPILIKNEIAILILIPFAISKMIADRDLDRSFTIADRFGDFYVAGNPATSCIWFTRHHHHNHNHQCCRPVPCTWQKKTYVASISIRIQMYSDIRKET